MHDPVIIAKNGRPRTVLLDYEDFLRLTNATAAFSDLDAELDAKDAAD